MKTESILNNDKENNKPNLINSTVKTDDVKVYQFIKTASERHLNINELLKQHFTENKIK
jgi:hypothetical protein